VAGGLNLYQFNGNNPAAYSDPFGLCPDACVIEGGVGDAAVLTGLAIAATAIVAGTTWVMRLTRDTGVAETSSAECSRRSRGKCTDDSSAEESTAGPVEGKSASEYDRHVQGVADARGQLQGLEGKLSNTKGPKVQQPIREQIDQLKQKIKNHEKEIRQKWPNGRPE